MKCQCLILLLALSSLPLCRGQYVYVWPYSGPARHVADMAATEFGVEKVAPVAVYGHTRLRSAFRYEKYKVMFIGNRIVDPVGLQLCYADVEWLEGSSAAVVSSPPSTFNGCESFSYSTGP